MAHSGQRAHACSIELQPTPCGAAQPVSQADRQHIQSHDSISESCRPNDNMIVISLALYCFFMFKQIYVSLCANVNLCFEYILMKVSSVPLL